MAAAQPNSLTRRKAAGAFARRRFGWVLAVITLAALIQRIWIGRSQFIHYDGYWHIFIASQDRWSQFITEWRGDAHPILYYLALRFITRLGHSHLVYRLPSIIPGVAAIYFFGRIAGKLYRNKAIAALAAIAFGFSIQYFDLSIDVRGYPLAMLFVLLAWVALLDFPAKSSALLRVSVFSALAMATEYLGVIFFCVCVVTLLIQAARFSSFREALISWVQQHPVQAAFAVSLPIAVGAAFYGIHLAGRPIAQNNVMPFYWDHKISAISFLVDGLHRDLNLFLPFELPAMALFIAFTAAGFAALLAFVLLNSDSQPGLAAATSVLMLPVSLAGLMLLSLLRVYPFGGYARQQSIILPFLVISAFALLDRLAAGKPRGIRVGLMILASLGIVASVAHGWSQYPKTSRELFSSEYAAFQNAFPRPPAVYVDQFSLIAYYIHNHRSRWHFERTYRIPEQIQIYDVTPAQGGSITILRDFDAWNFDLSQPQTYRSIARALDASGIPEAVLFLLKQPPVATAGPARQAVERNIRSLAEQAGLAADVRFYSAAEACVGLRLK